MIKLFLQAVCKGDTNCCRKKAGASLGIMGIILNLFLFVLKFFGGLLSNSTAITADAFNNLSDMGSSIITFIGFKMAGKPADRDHPFGHGRIEYVAGLMVSIFIIIMGFELAKTSFSKILNPQNIIYTWFSIITLVVSILVKLFMYYINKGVATEIKSSALKATAADSFNDCIATSVVLVGLVVSHFIKFNLDGYLGFGVAIFILISGIKSASETINPMLGERPDPTLVEMIKNEVLTDDRILGIHDIIIHNYGPSTILMSLHAEVPSTGDVLELHDLIDNMEKELKHKFNCEAVIHMDPIVIDDSRTNEIREKVTEIINNIDCRLSIHDFRMTDGHSHTNLIFDMVVPFNFSMTDAELVTAVENEISKIQGDTCYYVSINVDKDSY